MKKQKTVLSITETMQNFQEACNLLDEITIFQSKNCCRGNMSFEEYSKNHEEFDERMDKLGFTYRSRNLHTLYLICNRKELRGVLKYCNYYF